MRRAIVQRQLKVQRRLGGRASPESGRIIAPSFEKSYCRTMRQVIDRHRTIERGNVIFRKVHARLGSGQRRIAQKRAWPRDSTCGNSREKLATFHLTRRSSAIFLPLGHTKFLFNARWKNLHVVPLFIIVSSLSTRFSNLDQLAVVCKLGDVAISSG